MDSNELLYGSAGIHLQKLILLKDKVFVYLGYLHALLYAYQHTHDVSLLVTADETVAELIKQGRRYYEGDSCH